LEVNHSLLYSVIISGLRVAKEDKHTNLIRGRAMKAAAAAAAAAAATPSGPVSRPPAATDSTPTTQVRAFTSFTDSAF